MRTTIDGTLKVMLAWFNLNNIYIYIIIYIYIYIYINLRRSRDEKSPLFRFSISNRVNQCNIAIPDQTVYYYYYYLLEPPLPKNKIKYNTMYTHKGIANN